MYNHIGKYISKKLTGAIVQRAVQIGFWGLVFACPGPMIASVGVSGLVMTGLTLHSGVVEYGTVMLIP